MTRLRACLVWRLRRHTAPHIVRRRCGGRIGRRRLGAVWRRRRQTKHASKVWRCLTYDVAGDGWQANTLVLCALQKKHDKLEVRKIVTFSYLWNQFLLEVFGSSDCLTKLQVPIRRIYYKLIIKLII